MISYASEYNVAQNSISQIRQFVIKNHISHYHVLEEFLGFQYYLNRKFTEFVNSLKEPSSLKEQFFQLASYLLFFYNTQSLQTAFNALECDTIHQSAVNMRTVYESIPKMYYIALFPEEVGKIAVYEHICDLPYEKAITELSGEDCLTYLNGQKLEFKTKNDFLNFRRKYTPNAFRRNLYTEQRQKLLQKLYSKFSNSTHANITRNRTSVSYDRENTDFFFNSLKMLSYFNIVAYLEGSFELLHRLNLTREALDFLNEITKEFTTIYDDVYFFPDKEDLQKRLRVKPIKPE